MVKKTYIIPCTSVSLAQPEQILASSGVISNSNDINIGFGGVDTNGDQDPSVKESNHDFEWDF